MKLLASILALLALSTTSFAAGGLDKKLGKKRSSSDCSKIRKACVKAGYAPALKSVEIWEDCARPISLGQDAGRLKATPELTAAAKACRDKHAQSREGRSEKKASRRKRAADRGGASAQADR